jgi:EmrB/QacA subfamily drug resistance transporter
VQPSFELPTLTKLQRVATMIGSLLGLLLAALDNTIVATAAPAIQSDLHIASSLYIWVTVSYIVASTVLVPVWGKLSDLYGRKPALIGGMSIFLLGSALCGISGSTMQLILFRAVQGVGSAALFTNAFAVVADLFPPAERGKYQGIFGGVFGISSVVGPLVGGAITDGASWHWVFFVNIPIGAIALGFVAARMPMLRRPRTGPVRIDIAGAIALIVAIVPFLLAMSLGHSADVSLPLPGWPWMSWQILGLFGLSVVGLVAFLMIEKRAAEPLLDLKLFSNKIFAIGNAGAFTMGLAFLGPIFFLPAFMVNVVGLSATNSGLTTTPLTFGIVAGNIVSGQLVSRIGHYRILLLVSIAILAASFAVMGFTLAPDAGQLDVSIKMFFVGLGVGPSIPLFTLAIQNAVEMRQIGVATSAATFFRQMGMTVGMAIVGTVFATSLDTGMKHTMEVYCSEVPAQQCTEAHDHAADQNNHYDRATVDKAIDAKFDGMEQGKPPQVQAGMEQGRAAAHLANGHLDTNMKVAFTDAISNIFRVCVAIAILALFVTFALPEKPLRKGFGPPAPSE